MWVIFFQVFRLPFFESCKQKRVSRQHAQINHKSWISTIGLRWCCPPQTTKRTYKMILDIFSVRCCCCCCCSTCCASVLPFCFCDMYIYIVFCPVSYLLCGIEIVSRFYSKDSKCLLLCLHSGQNWSSTVSVATPDEVAALSPKEW